MFATIELQKQAVADRYYHQLHPKPWAKSPEEAAWALMQRIMGLVGEHKVPPLRGNLSGNLGEFGSEVPEQGEKLLLSSSGYRSEGVNRARSGGIDQGKPVFGTFKGERDEAKVMGNPSKNPLPVIGRVRNIFCL